MRCIFEQDGAERVMTQALALSGLTTAPDNADALLACATDSALALCCRRDVPRAMEGGVAVLLADLLRSNGDRPVSSVRRGDTAITYGSLGLSEARQLLQPFIRLRSV